MQAARVHAPRDIRVEEVETPSIGPREILIDVHAAGICKTDLEIYEGTFPHLRTGLLQLPRIPGHEWSGTVAQHGSEVTRFKPGDRVTGDTAIGCGECSYCLAGHYNLCPTRQTVGILRKDGAFAQQLVMPERHLYHIPENVSLDEAALVEPAAVAVHAVRRLSPSLGERCVVFGDGPLGQLCMQAVINAGATKVAMVGHHDYKLKVAKETGAQFTAKQTDDGFMDRLREWHDGEGPALVVEASGNATGIRDAVRLARPGGKIVNISFCGVSEISVDLDILVARELSIIGSIANPNSFPAALRLLSEGRLNVKPLITHKFELGQISDALEQIEAHSIEYLRVLVSATGK